MFARCSRNQWVDDRVANSCQVCATDFGVFTRKHHCRCCGRCICSSCVLSKHYSDGGMEKTCTDCVLQQRARVASPTTGSPGGSGYPGAQQQQPQMAYAPPMQPPLQQQQQGGFPPMPQQPVAGYPPQQQQGPPPPVMMQPGSPADAVLHQICNEFEMKPQYMNALHSLLNYDVALVCDDSGSMALQADDDNPNLSRWAELKQAVNIILRVTQAMGKVVDIYFINRGMFRGITCWNDIAAQFVQNPGGMTNTVRVLQQLWEDRKRGGVLSRPLVVHLFTDGHPTNAYGNEDIQGLANWLRYRDCISNTFFAILLCTDDEEVCNMYRPLEYRVQGRFGWTGSTCGIPGVDVTEDYRGEKRDILALRGPRFSFSFGDYIAKCLVGVIDPLVHMIDIPAGSNMYMRSGRNNNGGGGCAQQ